MRICKAIFSTNRLEYLIPTLESFHKNLDFGNHEVDGIFIDDWPTGRNDGFIEALAKKYGYNRVVLHQENMGLTSTWQHLNELLAEKEYDYIWHQEDDVELLHPVKLDDMLRLIQTDEFMCQVSLRRSSWYDSEIYNPIEDSDILFENFRYNKRNEFFTPMASLYPYWISQVPFKRMFNICPSEAVVMHTINKMNDFKLYIASIKQLNGDPFINHFGEISHGKRVNEGEPGWDFFKNFDPAKEYYSRSGIEFTQNKS